MSNGNAPDKLDVHKKCDGRCGYCGGPLKIQDMTVDHMLPRSRGGTSNIKNLLPSCEDCNSIKGNCTVEEFRDALSKKLEANPSRLLRIWLKLEMVRETGAEVVFWFEK